MQQIIPYNLDDDPVIEALRAEGAADPDVLGILVPARAALAPSPPSRTTT